MYRFFIDRPIVAMVIAIITVIVGLVAMQGLPVAQYPNIVPPEIRISTVYVGADASTVEQSVATPIEQQLSGVDGMNYVYSINANDGSMRMVVDFDVKTDPSTDQVLTQMRELQADPQLPVDVRSYGVSVIKSPASPLVIFALYSPKGSYDGTFLANYAYIHLNDQLTRVPGIASVTIFGAGQYAMRCWVRPDLLAKMNLTIPEIVNALQKQNTVNPAGQVGGEPIPPGQEFTYSIRAQGRLVTPEEFGRIVLRANPDGSIVRLSDVARIELGTQDYGIKGRYSGKPAALVAIYQTPGSNALDAVAGARKVMSALSKDFPPDLAFTPALDTTLSVTEGIHEIVVTLFIAMVLVIVVVFVFLQGWRATLIPAVAVPVSLIGTFAFFPLLGFSINPIALMGMVVAIGLVVDDAIVVVEAVERHIEAGMTPRDATIRAMEQVAGPVLAIALVLAAVFLPTIFIPGITGRLYQQFAVTIAISVLLSAFNALTLSPALSALVLKPRGEAKGASGAFFGWFNRLFGRAETGYVKVCRGVIRKAAIGLILLAAVAGIVGILGSRIPGGFLPEEDQGYLYAGIQLPFAASLQRTQDATRTVERIILDTPGVRGVTTINGFNLLSQSRNTYSGFFFIALKPWSERGRPEEAAAAIQQRINAALSRLPQGVAFSFSPPAIQGIGTSGGVTFMLEDRAGREIAFLAENARKFVAAAQKRPEFSRVSTTLLPDVPQIFVEVDRDKALSEGVDLGDVYRALQSFMGGAFVNYFNRFGRQWQVYLQAEGDYRTDISKLGQFYVRNGSGGAVPLSALTKIERRLGPEFVMRYNLYRSAQINAAAAPGYSSGQAMAALEAVFRETMPADMGFDYLGMSFQEKKAQEGVPTAAIFALSLLFVFLILAALYESWSLPFSVLLGTPVAVFGAFVALTLRSMELNVYGQIGLIVLIGLAAKNAILIVEFAKKECEGGMGAEEAALAGAKLRLRPILMTSFAFILGCVPLAVATGAGGIARRVLGTDVVGGMLAATGIGIFIIPMTFYVVERFGRRGGKVVASAALLAVVLASCTVGPDYRRPKVEAPDRWMLAEQEARGVADTAWWERFGDPVLNDLIASGIRENPDVQVAAARVEEFGGRLAIVRGGLFPNSGVGVSAERERLSREGLPPLAASSPNMGNVFKAAVGASWEIDLWGKARRATEAARADLLASEEGRRGTVLSLVGSVAAGYLNLRALDRQLEIAGETARSREASNRLQQIRFKGGIVSELDPLQAQSEYEQAMAAIPTIEKAIARQEHSLSLLLGRNPGPIPRGASIDNLSIPAVPAGIPAELLERRPDILQAEQALVAANARIGDARAQYFPSISLTGSFGGTSTQLSSLFSGPARTWDFAAPVTAPIFTGGAIAGGVKTAEAQHEQLLIEYRRTIRNAFADVEDALSDRKRTQDQLDAQMRQIDTLRNYSRVARLRYGNGYTGYLEVLDAERNLFNAELAVAQTRGALCLASVNLYKAMGGGWAAAERARPISPRSPAVPYPSDHSSGTVSG